jgi:hypothetical protein
MNLTAIHGIDTGGRQRQHLKVQRATEYDISFEKLVRFRELGLEFLVPDCLRGRSYLPYKFFESPEGANRRSFERTCQLLDFNELCPFAPSKDSFHPAGEQNEV